VFYIAVFISVFSGTGFSQTQRPIDHSDYDDWKTLSKQTISSEGKLISYVINPFKGDGWMYLYQSESGELDSLFRGSNPKFSFNSKLLVYHIKPQFDTVRAAKLKKVKKEKLPKDSLGIWLIEDNRQIKFAKLKNYQLPEGETDWMAILLEKPKDSKPDSLISDSLDNAEKSKEKSGDRLLIFNPISSDSLWLEDVKHYTFSKNGKSCAIVQMRKDSIDSVLVSVFDTEKQILDTLFFREGASENISLDQMGSQLAFTYSQDTGSAKVFNLYYFDLKNKKGEPLCISCDNATAIAEDWSVSKNGKLYFNDAGSELYFGTAPKPEPEPKDTLTNDEKVSLDIWNWKDPYLQPHQLKQLEDEQKRTYTAVYFPKSDVIRQLASPDIERITIHKKAEGDYSLAFSNKPYRQELSWDGSGYRDYYLINRSTGERQKILEKVASIVSLSPDQKYVAWYAIADSSWNIYNVKDQQSVNLTLDMDFAFYNKENDVPNEARPHGMAGWTEDKQLVIYDRYDLWQFDPTGKNEARNLTNGMGRQKQIEFRYIKLDKELQYLPNQMLLYAFVVKSKQSGFFSLDMKNGEMQELLLEDYFVHRPLKAKDAEVFIWQKESFQIYPDLYVSDSSFKEINKISNTNPQQKNYLWGTVELVDWNTFDGDSLSGLLYKPANFDPNKKYPMLVYFYERYADRLNVYHQPKPIRSVINFTYYTSNGYLIFVPDIVYKTGYPGPSAFDCVVSGTQAMLNKYSFIDGENLGIQGQSWGGYQTAYIITQTNMFKAAMAGAPVSNMTRAYGGIRWGSGLSRAFQYEETQSRIGGTLWEKRDLYILNSPLFFADQIQTPLLMMHNDKDGAVPWYQGIE
ncbi:MAG: S9 family peptidase, partial [Bacteroidetes bacterium]